MFDMTQYAGKQLMWVSISAVIALVILLTDVKIFSAFAYVIYGIMIGLLILAFLISPEVKGAHAWIKIGNFWLQPAEFAKYGTALALAKFLSGYNVKFNKPKNLLICCAMIIVPMAIILLQNDTGSALVFVKLCTGILPGRPAGFLAGARIDTGYHFCAGAGRKTGDTHYMPGCYPAACRILLLQEPFPAATRLYRNTGPGCIVGYYLLGGVRI